MDFYAPRIGFFVVWKEFITDRYFTEERRGCLMARIDAAYNYLLSTYGKTTGSRYDSHRKSELRSVYNNIIKTNKDSPLYKITQTGDVTEFAIDIKENARRIQNVIASLSDGGDHISSMLNKKVAVSSDESAVSVYYVGNGSHQEQSAFDMTVISLATPQINEGHYLKRNDYSFEEGTFSFDLDTSSNSYEFQFNVNPGDNNYDVQSKIARLINQSDVGLTAEVPMNDKGESALRIISKQTGLSEDEKWLFSIQSGSSWNEINKLGIAHITSPATNSVFLLNGTEHASLSNTFTINKAFEVTMHQPTTDGQAVHIGFKANTDAISDGINEMLQAYNGMVTVGHRYAAAHNNHRLLNEVTSIGRQMTDALASVGIHGDENDFLSLSRDTFAEAITSDDAKQHFATLDRFKNALQKESQKIAINPMNYVDKVIVEYKNPGKTFAAPYVPSIYSGMLVDRFL